MRVENTSRCMRLTRPPIAPATSSMPKPNPASTASGSRETRMIQVARL